MDHILIYHYVGYFMCQRAPRAVCRAADEPEPVPAAGGGPVPSLPGAGLVHQQLQVSRASVCVSACYHTATMSHAPGRENECCIGLYIYIKGILLTLLYKATYNHLTLHSPIHTLTAESTMQGDSQLVRSSQREASCSGTPSQPALPPEYPSCGLS